MDDSGGVFTLLGLQTLILYGSFVLGFLAFKPLLVLGICFKLRFGCPLGRLFLGFGSKSLFSGLLACKHLAISVRISVKTLVTHCYNHLEGFDGLFPLPPSEVGDSWPEMALYLKPFHECSDLR